MHTHPISTIIILEGVRETHTFATEEDIHRYMEGGESPRFELLMDLHYLRVYRNTAPAIKEYATLAFVIEQGVVATIYKPV